MSVKKTELDFKRTTLQSKIFSWTSDQWMYYVWYSWCNWLVYNLGTEAEHEKDGKTLRIRKGMVKDKTESIEIVLFSSLLD